MIPELFINEWKQFAPWIKDEQVEQDLVLSRAIVEIYSDTNVQSKLAFRGGTALHKLHLKAPARYSEDLDFLQIDAEPIGKTMDLIRSKLDPWLGEPKRESGKDLIKLLYRYRSETSDLPMKLKIEINAREHFATRNLVHIPFRIDSQWFSGKAKVTSLRLDWLLGSKLRALYQRRKSRDLYDLYTALFHEIVSADDVVAAFQEHIRAQSLSVSRAEFEKNLLRKLEDSIFLQDLPNLLTADQNWDVLVAHRLVSEKIISKLPGEPWKGDKSPSRVKKKHS